ncbi:hypothetical protein BD410DRAFT_510893 [Rickenella mellea]|uniref:Uncharacterized protein n=1 Tax=Rickenella mellea TaxID=50990 RepID=A0A4Y7PSC5_9AGAM|nr:hypothetical protein BD410DRAFT_510893 [Rickenella mellea]
MTIVRATQYYSSLVTNGRGMILAISAVFGFLDIGQMISQTPTMGWKILNQVFSKFQLQAHNTLRSGRT